MYADVDARGGILEPPGIVEVALGCSGDLEKSRAPFKGTFRGLIYIYICRYRFRHRCRYSRY